MNDNFVAWLDQRITDAQDDLDEVLGADSRAAALEAARLAELIRVRAEAADYGA